MRWLLISSEYRSVILIVFVKKTTVWIYEVSYIFVCLISCDTFSNEICKMTTVASSYCFMNRDS